ncbi:MAG: ribose ABC transporter permease [Bacillota bacterium]|uniref:ABC transporter permease n=1 Tax=Anaerotruncus colihominis TaxID=169435 RepID=UPI000D7AE7E2|nr:ABC transporter permease [Anaerotruncus colihominis]PWM75841.1 MAG: ribose ABC transporter permease [Bacillota bacterium]
MRKVMDIIKEYTIFIILIVLAIVFATKNPAFLKITNLLTILRQSCIMGILGMGEMSLIVVGGLNLSMGACVALSSVLIAILSVKVGLAWPVVIAITLIVDTLIGFVTGFIINRTKIVPMIGTMALSTIISGIAYLACGGLPISGVPESIKVFYQGSVGVIPAPILLAAAIIIVMGVIFKYTYFGRSLFAIGSNREAARLSGINADRMFIAAYTICGTLCGVAGLLMAGRVGSGNPTSGATLDMDVLSALVIGGVSFLGGEGKVTKAVGGILLITMLTNGLTLSGVTEYVQMIITGGVFLLAVILDSIQHNHLKLIRFSAVKRA